MATRRDREHLTVYVDDGCDLAPACLSCPFVRCRYDPQPRYKPLISADDIPALRARGASVAALSTHSGLSRGAVMRIAGELPME